MNKKNISLVIVVVLIIGSIAYLQSKKPAQLNPSLAPDVTVAPITTAPGSTDITDATAASTTPSATQTAPTTPAAPSVDRTALLAQKASQYSKAKELVNPSGFVNTAPFKLSDYVGKKVILVDFWTYSCINCQRTIPYLNAWYQKYKDAGLVIVGVHTPEFDFEKNIDNVTAGAKKLGIQYPIALDNNMDTWNAYRNQFWPHEYLIDIDGYVVHDHIGEGAYADTEQAIQKALIERVKVLGLSNTVPTGITNPSDVITMDESKVNSPETYFGSARNEYLANGAHASGSQTLSIPKSTSPNKLYLDGTWNFKPEYAESTSTTSKIIYTYTAKNVYFVASAGSPVKIKILRDGVPVSAEKGSDVAADGTVTINENRLYTLINESSYGTHTLEIDVQGSGLDAYTFTFG